MMKEAEIMAELTTLRGIGKEIARKLESVGITTAEALCKTGSKEAFFKMKLEYPEVCLVHLYVLEGAVTNTEYNMLSEDTKKNLKAFSDSL